MLPISEHVLVDHVNAPISNASNTDDYSDFLDMTGYEGVLFIVPLTDSAATGVATVTAYDNTAASSSGANALAGGVVTATCAINDDLNSRVLMIDVHKPRQRYVGVRQQSATANIAFGDTVAIRYGASKQPTTQGTEVIASAKVTGVA
jgi:hypothetical protein